MIVICVKIFLSISSLELAIETSIFAQFDSCRKVKRGVLGPVGVP